MNHYKALIIAIVFTLCLALMGCGQSSVKPAQTNLPEETVKQAEDQNEEPIEDKTAETESEQIAEEPDVEVDNMNPRQDAEGLYVYNVQGHEIRTRTNIWNYIGEAKIDGEPVQNYFSLSVLAEKLGYTKKYTADGAYKSIMDDGSYVYAGFQYDGGTKTSYIVSGKRSASNDGIASGTLYVEPYNFDKMGYLYQEDHYVNLDMIILCVYSMEYYADGKTGNCWEDIFGETVPRIAP